MKQEHIERFYDYYDQVASLLYETDKTPYIEGMNEAFNFLLDDTLTKTYDQDVIHQLQRFRDEIIDISFEREEVRKSVQLGMLKGYKHTYSSNALITPDTIGIFIGYIVKKLYARRELSTVFDPFVGSGNLLYTIANQLELDLKIYGVDNDIVKCQLSRNLGDLLEYHNEMFYQDSMTFYQQGFDLLVSDLPLHDSGTYMPYQYINHHIDSVIDGGFAFILIENDFFEQDQSDIFKEEITNKAQIFGLIKLHESSFKHNPKSILILRKKGEGVTPLTDFLLVDLPAFSDMQGFEQTIQQIDLWIAQREDEIL